MKQITNGWLIVGIMVFLISGCGQQSGKNPFEGSSQTQTTNLTDEVSPMELAGIHQSILKPSCAIPGCHDGHFEPDFRTPQSSFSTTVWQPIIKNNAQNEFEYRVVPFKPEASVLFERINNCCFVNQDDRMPQDDIGQALPDEEIEAIETWIREGAKDIFGKSQPNPYKNEQYSINE